MKENKNNKSALKACIIFIFIVFTVFLTSRYLIDEEFRNYIDVHILKKEISEEKLNTIEINKDANQYIYAYDKYITVLSKNTLKSYTSNGNIDSKMDVNISVPIFVSNGKYMLLAEKNGNKVYLISGSNILWESDVEGEISRACVNKNGYASVILKNTTCKSVVILFSPDGKELFRTYLNTNYAVCVDISENNKYLAVGEVNYSGTVVKSYVKIISVDKAQTDPNNYIEYTYESEVGDIIVNINYQNKEDAICLFNNYIQKVTNKESTRIYDITNDDIFTDINLNSGIAIVKKQSSGLFSYEYELNIKDIDSNVQNLYILKNTVPKSLKSTDSNMAICLGDEVQIINSKGWLIKKYISSKQSNGVVLGNNIAGIIYKNKIEIISF